MIHCIRAPVVAGVLAAFVAMSAGQAEAALVDCGPGGSTDLTGNVYYADLSPAASDCQYLTPPDPSNVANLSNINDAGLFGTTNWAAVQMQVGPGGSTGTWSIAGANFSAFDYMIVFKDGQGTNLIGFLLNELDDSGLWDTPFLDPPFNLPGQSTSHNVSHYSIVVRDPTGNPVPEPGVLGLMGLGLLGLGLTAYARRRRAA